MEFTFVQLPGFTAKWEAAGLTDNDLQALELHLRFNPMAGPVLAGTGGVRKVRFAPPSKHTGKSGAFRVGYSYVRVADTVYLLALFGKKEQANFTAMEKAELRALASRLAELHRDRLT